MSYKNYNKNNEEETTTILSNKVGTSLRNDTNCYYSNSINNHHQQDDNILTKTFNVLNKNNNKQSNYETINSKSLTNYSFKEDKRHNNKLSYTDDNNNIEKEEMVKNLENTLKESCLEINKLKDSFHNLEIDKYTYVDKLALENLDKEKSLKKLNLKLTKIEAEFNVLIEKLNLSEEVRRNQNNLIISLQYEVDKLKKEIKNYNSSNSNDNNNNNIKKKVKKENQKIKSKSKIKGKISSLTNKTGVSKKTTNNNKTKKEKNPFLKNHVS